MKYQDEIFSGCSMTVLKNGKWLVTPTRGLWGGVGANADHAYIGVDFGTATTVVSRVTPSANSETIEVEPLRIPQPSAHGGIARDALINTVLSYKENQLLFGVDAYRLRSKLVEGRNTFSSFKMGMGLDLGPEYPHSMLSASKGRGIIIERPADATREFLKYVVKAIESEIPNVEPKNIRYAFTVPASFQANQRRELLEAIRQCGLDTGESCLIDEPNAAFLSYIHDVARSSEDSHIINKAKNSAINVLVYDFGAGTCDLSLIEFSMQGGPVKSRNRAISKFTALGGDDVDRKIAMNYLIHQLRDSEGKAVELTMRVIEEHVLKRLMPAAEQLKIAISRSLLNAGIATVKKAYALIDLVYETHPVDGIKLREEGEISIKCPSLSLYQYLEVMDEFCGDLDPASPGYNVAAPVADVLDKAGMAEDEVDAVIFIGGSALSSLVRSAVMHCFSSNVKEIVPRDLQVHVSRGAAIHAFGLHGLGMDFIAPITSEAVCIVTKGGGVEILIPVAALLPIDEPFELNLEVSFDGQSQVDIPICGGSKERLIGILNIHPPKNEEFHKGDLVHVLGIINKEKILEVTVSVAGKNAVAQVMNPLSNGTPTAKELKLLKQKQNFNESLLKNNGRPDLEVVENYSEAAADAGEYELAADLLIALERMNSRCDFSSNIAVYYSRAGRSEKSKLWHGIAHKRFPSELTAYNMYCVAENRQRKEDYLRESLRYDNNYILALSALSGIVSDSIEKQKINYQIVDLLSGRLDMDQLNDRYIDCLHNAATAIGANEVAQKASINIRERRLKLTAEDDVYKDENLASSKKIKDLLLGGR